VYLWTEECVEASRTGSDTWTHTRSVVGSVVVGWRSERDLSDVQPGKFLLCLFPVWARGSGAPLPQVQCVGNSTNEWRSSWLISDLGEEHHTHTHSWQNLSAAKTLSAPPSHTHTHTHADLWNTRSHTHSSLLQSYCRHWVKLSAGCEAHHHTHTHTHTWTDAACVYSLVKSTVSRCAKHSFALLRGHYHGCAAQNNNTADSSNCVCACVLMTPVFQPPHEHSVLNHN